MDGLEIRDLKCFRDVTLEMRGLTLLTGLNSSGKSTTLQALLLADIAARGISEVPLIGESGLAMGEAQDALHREAPGRGIEITTLDGGLRSTTRFEVPEAEGAVTLHVARLPDTPAARIGAYLSAERLGPRDALEISGRPRDELNVGHQGQYTAQVLAEDDRRIVEEPRRVPLSTGSSLPATLGTQAEAWLSRIVRPIQVQASRVPGTSMATLRFREPVVTAEWVRPSNVGFGLSYALPIVVAGLTVPQGSLFVVENPEAHLHPSGQSLIGEFLARISSSGVQVIVETHSDHVLNGVRRSTVIEDAPISPTDVIIHFYGENGSTTPIEVTRTGGLSAWPVDFFDQIERDLTDISRQAPRR